MTALEYFRLFAAEFEAVEDATVNQWLSIAALRANTGCLDAETAAMAQAYYAAHQLALTKKTEDTGGACGVSGPVTMEKEGDLQRSYGAGPTGSGTLTGQTAYGQQYLDLTKICSGFGILTRVA